MSTPIVHIQGLHKSFGNRKILDGLDWNIEAGQVIGLLGRNGIGKSTLLECLLGLQETDSGSVTLYGAGVLDLPDTVRAKIAYVPQQSDLFGWLTPLQLLDYFKALYPRWNDARVSNLLVRWGLDGDKRHRPISSLSGGEKQRLSVIRALAHEPELLILDEPVAALDPVGRRDFLHELIEDVVTRETTVVFSTHILSDLERVALDIAFLKDGKIALQGPLDDLLERARRIVGPASRLQHLSVPGELRRSGEVNGEMSIVAVADAAQLEKLANESANAGVRLEALTLEDLLIEVTQ
jgi:ABC-2 type transport system ATP-binding protein